MHRVAIGVLAVSSVLGACAQTRGDHEPECFVDDDCGTSGSTALVCARPGECLPANRVQDVTLQWTINGAVAGAQTCVPIPNLMVRFDGTDFNDELTFSPVPCSQGQFHVDKLPTRFVSAQLGIDGRGFDNAARIDDETGIAQFDLMPDLMP